MAIDLYYYPGCPSSMAVVMTVRALGLDVNMHTIDLSKKEHLTAEYAKINPLHKVPVIRDNGFLMSESRAIMLYLARVHGVGNALYPEDRKLQAEIDKFLFFDCGTLHMPIHSFLLPQVRPKDADIQLGEADREKVISVLDQLESLFPDNTRYVTGDQCTLADISLISKVANLLAVDFDLTPWKKIHRWVDLCKQLDFYAEYEKFLDRQRKQYNINKSAN